MSRARIRSASGSVTNAIRVGTQLKIIPTRVTTPRREDSAEYGTSLDAGHQKVEDDEIRGLGEGYAEALGTVGLCQHVMAVGLQLSKFLDQASLFT